MYIHAKTPSSIRPIDKTEHRSLQRPSFRGSFPLTRSSLSTSFTSKMSDAETTDVEDYELLKANQNRKNKKAGGWQSMGLSSVYHFVDCCELFRIGPRCLQRHQSARLPTANAHPTEGDPADPRRKGRGRDVADGLGQNRRLRDPSAAEIEATRPARRPGVAPFAHPRIGPPNLQGRQRSEFFHSIEASSDCFRSARPLYGSPMRVLGRRR